MYVFRTRHHSRDLFSIELRVASSGVAWKGISSEETISIPATDLKWAQWLRVARGFQLRLGLRDHRKHRFDGFVREVHNSPKRYFFRVAHGY